MNLGLGIGIAFTQGLLPSGTIELLDPGTVYDSVPTTLEAVVTGSVTSVVFYENYGLGYSVVGTAISAPWAVPWTPSDSGPVTLRASAYSGTTPVATNNIGITVGLLATYRLLQLSSICTPIACWCPGIGEALDVSNTYLVGWTDLSGQYALVQTTPGVQFSVNATGWDGSRCFTASGAQYMMWALPTAVKNLINGNDQNCAMAVATDTATTTCILGGPYGATTAHRAVIWKATTLRWLRASSYFTAADEAGRRHIVGRNVGTSGYVSVDGVQKNSGTVDAASMTMTLFGLGAATPDGGSPSNYVTGNFGPVLLATEIPDPAALTVLWTSWGYGHE